MENLLTIGAVLAHKQESAQPEPRSLSAIAREIRRTWLKVHYAAEPYLSAMSTLNSVQDNYIQDSGVSIVLYFLCNARTWKGEDAKRIKAELKTLAGIK